MEVLASMKGDKRNVDALVRMQEEDVKQCVLLTG